jgi:hypothetical protein
MKKNDKKREKETKVAPGMEDDPRWEKATKDDRKKGNTTKVTRTVWDENDPS